MMREEEGGFTLVEMLIALGLFALIGAAGLTLLDGVLRAQERTDGRLQRLGELERALHLLTLDLEQADPGSLVVDSQGVRFLAPGGAAVRYAYTDRVLLREVGLGAGAAVQPLVTDVAKVEWAFRDPGAGWRPDWPADVKGAPDAAALTLTLAEGAPGPGGALRRIVALTAEPPEDPLAGLGGLPP